MVEGTRDGMQISRERKEESGESQLQISASSAELGVWDLKPVHVWSPFAARPRVFSVTGLGGSKGQEMETQSRNVSLYTYSAIMIGLATASFYAGLLIGSKQTGGGGKGTREPNPKPKPKLSSQEPVSTHMICGRSLPCKFPRAPPLHLGKLLTLITLSSVIIT